MPRLALSLLLCLVAQCAAMQSMLRAVGLGSSHVAPQDCSKRKPKSYLELTSVKESAVGAGAPPFPCVRWYNAAAAGTVEADTDLSAEDQDVIKAPMLGGHGYAGDGKYSDNCNNLLGGRPLAEWNQPPGGQKGWEIYGAEGTPWRNQILEFAKQLATALNKLPDTRSTVYRGGWSKKAKLEAMKAGDIQKKAGFVSTSADESWAQGFAHDYHYPRSGPRGDVKEPGYVSVMYTIKAHRAKDIRRLNPRESELILLPNSKLKVISVKLEANMPFAAYGPDKVAKWLEAFEPPMTKSAAQVRANKVDGNMILEAYVAGDFFSAQELICGKEKVSKYVLANPECGYENPGGTPEYLDADGEKKSLYVMLRGPSQGKGEFAGMFKQKYAYLASAGRSVNVPSKVGMFYAIEMEEVVDGKTA